MDTPWRLIEDMIGAGLIWFGLTLIALFAATGVVEKYVKGVNKSILDTFEGEDPYEEE